MHRRNGLLIAASAGLLASACGSSSSSPAVSVTPTTTNVQIDNKTDAFNAGFTAYFPNEVKAHAGDTIHFTSVFRGEPHTVVLGKLVQAGLEAFDKAAAAAGGPQNAPDDHTIPELAKIPDLIPDPAHAPPGTPLDANQVTAQPCFLDTGDPPAIPTAPCPQKAQPGFTGEQSFYSSGFLPDQATFDVKLSSGIKPGGYRYMCALHRTGMEGTITVVDNSTSLPSAADVQKQATDQLQKKVAAVQPAVDKANQGDPTKPQAGVGTFQQQDTEGNIFAPKAANIPVGGSITWTILGAHTIAFNAPQDATPIINKRPDGSVHLNPLAGRPTGNPGVPRTPAPSPSGSPSASAAASPSASASPSGSPGGSPGGAPQLPTPTLHNLGKVPATGFWNTGIILSFPDPSDPSGFIAVKMTFPTAGTYQYKCLVHPDMEGTVKVG